MIRFALLATAATLLATPTFAQDASQDQAAAPARRSIAMSAEHPNEEAVDPYAQTNANAGATPFSGTAMFEAFHGHEGIARIVDGFVGRNVTDPRIMGQFAATDQARFKRTLREQFCYILGGGCAYTGRDMASSHKDLGSTAGDMGAIVENLQAAMRDEGVPFAVQNRFLAKLAPMKPDVVTR